MIHSSGGNPGPHSARVRLEVAFLDADDASPAPAPLSTHDERPRLTALVVAAEPDVRRYVRECLRERTDVQLLEAGTATAAAALAGTCAPDLLIVADAEFGVLATELPMRAIVLVDDVPHGSPAAGANVRLLARPFTAEGLLAEVRWFLG